MYLFPNGGISTPDWKGEERGGGGGRGRSRLVVSPSSIHKAGL